MKKITVKGLLIRKFIISFYFNDNTVMIYEQEVFNSGFKNGTFLEKGLYKNLTGGLKRKWTTFSTG